MLRKSKSCNDICSDERFIQQTKRSLSYNEIWYGSVEKPIFSIINTGDISKQTIDGKVIQKKSPEIAEQEIILKDDTATDDISEISATKSSIQKEELRLTTVQEVQEQTNEAITLISGELQVQVKQKQATRRKRKMDPESETDLSDYVILNQDQQEWRNEGTEESEEREKKTEIIVSLEESTETAAQKESAFQEGNEELITDMQGSLDDMITFTDESTGICSSSDDVILEVLNEITELMKEHGIKFENLNQMNCYVRQKFAINHYFILANVFDNILDDDETMIQAEMAFVNALYENIVRAALLYTRLNGFLLLRCIIDNPTFDTTIYEIDDVINELQFLDSVCSDAEVCICFKKRKYQEEFVSCALLFEIVEFIGKNENDNLLARGVVQTVKFTSFFDPNLFLVTRNDVEKLYQRDVAIVANFDLLTDKRFFTSNLHAAKQTMVSKALVVKYANIHVQLSFVKLLMQHIATIRLDVVDKLVDWKLCFEENRKDDCYYNVLQVQEMIRNEYGTTKNVARLARDLCCQLIFYCETDWFWSEIIRLINLNIDMTFSISMVFQSLPTVTEYLLGRKVPKNKTSLNLFYFIKEFLMVVPHKEFINHRYAHFISGLCESILNPATVINRILIPNLKQPIRKICAALTIGKLLESKNVNISWSFDYTTDNVNYDDETITNDAEEKVEMIRLIGAIYSQYTFPLRNTIHGARYFYIDFVLSNLENRLTHLSVFENSFTPNALKYLDELIAKKNFSWQADYYLTKVLLRKLLAAREVNVPERPKDGSDVKEYIEWINQLLPITYAGIKSRAFFALAFLINGFLTNSILECAFVLRFNDIPEFSFIEFLIIFKIFMHSNKTNRVISLRKHNPGRYGSVADRNLQEMVTWLFRLINRVCKSERIDDTAILHAKHRILQWAEAYVANSSMFSIDDAKTMLLLLKWNEEPGLKDDELNRGMDRLSFEIYQKTALWPENLTLEMLQTWNLYERSVGQAKEYLKNYIPPACTSSIKVYKPTRLLLNDPTFRPEILSPWTQWLMNKFLKDTIEFRHYGKGSKMRDRSRSGLGMYSYGRLLHAWSIDGIKLMPFIALTNECEDLLCDLSKVDYQRREIPFDLQVEIDSIQQTFPSKNGNIQKEKSRSSQSINLPISHNDENEMFQTQIQSSYDPESTTPMDADDEEINFGASAANLEGNRIIKRSCSVPKNFSNFFPPMKQEIPSLQDLSKQQMSQMKQESIKPTTSTVQEQKSRTLLEQGEISGQMENLQSIPPEMFWGRICPAYYLFPRQIQVMKERTLLSSFLDAGEPCKNCGLMDHTEIFCPKMLNYSNLLAELLPVTYKWTIKKEKAFENLRRQDSWGSFSDEEDDD